MTTAVAEVNHAEQNAKNWLEKIEEMVKALDGECEECGLIEGCHVTGCSLDDDSSREEAEQRIQEAPLSVEVRSGWANHPVDFEAQEYRILLTFGGPALQIVGEIGRHGQPETATLQYQDWGTPWTDYRPSNQDALLTFARQFYFGE